MKTIESLQPGSVWRVRGIGFLLFNESYVSRKRRRTSDGAVSIDVGAITMIIGPSSHDVVRASIPNTISDRDLTETIVIVLQRGAMNVGYVWTSHLKEDLEELQ